MHMADALLSPAVAGTMYACSTAAAVYAGKKLKLENEERTVPVMGVMGAFVFSAQMINFTIPGTGASGHLCGGLLLTAVVGPYAAFLTMIGVLLIQCLMFADGGLLALGANVWNMAFYGCFLGGMLWRLIMRKGISRNKILAASVAGSVLALQVGAFSVSVETLASGITELPFGAFLAAMQPIHLAIGLVEGLITAAVLGFIYEMRPALLWQGSRTEETERKNRLSHGRLLVVLAVLAAGIGGGLSLAASSFPDGLEWSIERLTGETELASMGNRIYEWAQGVQSATALLPDYSIPGSEQAAGTSVSGLIGAALVIGICLLAGKLIRMAGHKHEPAE